MRILVIDFFQQLSLSNSSLTDIDIITSPIKKVTEIKQDQNEENIVNQMK